MRLLPEPVPSSLRALPTLLPRLAIGALLLCVAACATRMPAPVEERMTPRVGSPVLEPAPPPPPSSVAVVPDWRPQTYTVKRGDTLYAIALDHGLDYRELAALNHIENLNLIRPGQVLRLAAAEEPTASAAGVQTTPLKTVAPVVAGDGTPVPSLPIPPAAGGAARNTENYKTQPKAVKEPYSEQALRDLQRITGTAPVSPPESPPAIVARIDPKPTPEAQDHDDNVDWVWPVKGKIVTGFSEAASLKGIDIAGTAGQAVGASASGKVVYAGSGLRGYGKLIIIKHNATYLSAYAHNRDLLVKEGQQVAKGQKIAEMGTTDADQVKLHFEIRRLGKPMDPLKFLPPA